MKHSIIGKFFSLFMLILLSQTSLFGSVRYVTEYYTSEQKTRVENALDSALKAYSSAKTKLNDIEAYNGTDSKKIALRDQAQSLKTQLKEKYDATVKASVESVSTYHTYDWGCSTDIDYTQYSYNPEKVKKTEELSKEVVDLGAQASALYCQFNGGTWANGECTQSSGSGDDDSNKKSGSNDTTITTDLQQTISDNVQNIITNINNNVSNVPECHAYGAFGECLY